MEIINNVLVKVEKEDIENESVIIPEGVESIDSKAFAPYIWFNNITIPNSVTKIDSYAFCLCCLESIVIPNSVKYLGENVFFGCDKLTSVTYKGENFTTRCVNNNLMIVKSSRRKGEYTIYECEYFNEYIIGSHVTYYVVEKGNTILSISRDFLPWEVSWTCIC